MHAYLTFQDGSTESENGGKRGNLGMEKISRGRRGGDPIGHHGKSQQKNVVSGNDCNSTIMKNHSNNFCVLIILQHAFT